MARKALIAKHKKLMRRRERIYQEMKKAKEEGREYTPPKNWRPTKFYNRCQASGNQLHVTGNLVEDIPVIRMYSKPSRRWYIGWQDIRPVAWGRGIWILSTSQGLMASHEAKKKKIWGELIAEIY